MRQQWLSIMGVSLGVIMMVAGVAPASAQMGNDGCVWANDDAGPAPALHTAR
jgi:hypothetical protein